MKKSRENYVKRLHGKNSHVMGWIGRMKERIGDNFLGWTGSKLDLIKLITINPTTFSSHILFDVELTLEERNLITKAQLLHTTRPIIYEIVSVFPITATKLNFSNIRIGHGVYTFRLFSNNKIYNSSPILTVNIDHQVTALTQSTINVTFPCVLNFTVSNSVGVLSGYLSDINNNNNTVDIDDIERVGETNNWSANIIVPISGTYRLFLVDQYDGLFNSGGNFVNYQDPHFNITATFPIFAFSNIAYRPTVTLDFREGIDFYIPENFLFKQGETTVVAWGELQENEGDIFYVGGDIVLTKGKWIMSLDDNLGFVRRFDFVSKPQVTDIFTASTKFIRYISDKLTIEIFDSEISIQNCVIEKADNITFQLPLIISNEIQNLESKTFEFDNFRMDESFLLGQYKFKCTDVDSEIYLPFNSVLESVNFIFEDYTVPAIYNSLVSPVVNCIVNVPFVLSINLKGLFNFKFLKLWNGIVETTKGIDISTELLLGQNVLEIDPTVIEQPGVYYIRLYADNTHYVELPDPITVISSYTIVSCTPNFTNTSVNYSPIITISQTGGGVASGKFVSQASNNSSGSLVEVPFLFTTSPGIGTTVNVVVTPAIQLPHLGQYRVALTDNFSNVFTSVFNVTANSTAISLTPNVVKRTDMTMYTIILNAAIPVSSVDLIGIGLSVGTNFLNLPFIGSGTTKIEVSHYVLSTNGTYVFRLNTTFSANVTSPSLICNDFVIAPFADGLTTSTSYTSPAQSPFVVKGAQRNFTTVQNIFYEFSFICDSYVNSILVGIADNATAGSVNFAGVQNTISGNNSPVSFEATKTTPLIASVYSGSFGVFQIREYYDGTNVILETRVDCESWYRPTLTIPSHLLGSSRWSLFRTSATNFNHGNMRRQLVPDPKKVQTPNGNYTQAFVIAGGATTYTLDLGVYSWGRSDTVNLDWIMAFKHSATEVANSCDLYYGIASCFHLATITTPSTFVINVNLVYWKTKSRTLVTRDRNATTETIIYTEADTNPENVYMLREVNIGGSATLQYRTSIFNGVSYTAGAWTTINFNLNAGIAQLGMRRTFGVRAINTASITRTITMVNPDPSSDHTTLTRSTIVNW